MQHQKGFQLSVPLKSPRTDILLFRPSAPNPSPTLTTSRLRCWAPLSWRRRSTWKAPASWSRFVFILMGCDKFLPSFLPATDISVVVVSLVQITGCTSPGKTVSIVVRGSNKLVIEEAERSIHDALCVIRCLVKKRSVVLHAQLTSQKNGNAILAWCCRETLHQRRSCTVSSCRSVTYGGTVTLEHSPHVLLS